MTALQFNNVNLILEKQLIPHKESISTAIRNIDVKVISVEPNTFKVCYELTGDLTQLRIPSPQQPASVEGLWKHTCFEMFIAVESEDNYHEFNFSPSCQWAAYAFNDYRLRNEWIYCQSPSICINQSSGRFLLEAEITTTDLSVNIDNKSLQINLTAVLEEQDGSLSYWALKHSDIYPDFHNRAGFIPLNHQN